MSAAPLRAAPAQRLRAPASRGANGRVAVRPRAVASPPAPSKAAWSPESWRSKKALQMPEYADPKALADSLAELRRSPPLIFAGEVRARRGGGASRRRARRMARWARVAPPRRAAARAAPGFGWSPFPVKSEASGCARPRAAHAPPARAARGAAALRAARRRARAPACRAAAWRHRGRRLTRRPACATAPLRCSAGARAAQAAGQGGQRRGLPASGAPSARAAAAPQQRGAHAAQRRCGRHGVGFSAAPPPACG
jgi:hypothetical protein